MGCVGANSKRNNNAGTAQKNVIKVEYKIVLVGAADAGKTSIILKLGELTNTKFVLKDDLPVQTEVTFTDESSDSIVKASLIIHDTLGAELYKTITSTFYQDAKGVIIIFDICDKPSFEECVTWFKESSRYASDAKKILVGNKSDLEHSRKIEKEAGKEFAQLQDVEYVETSAITGHNIKFIFEEICRTIFEYSY